MERTIDQNMLEDKKICIAIMSSFSILTIQYLILVYFNLIDTSIGQMIQLISKGLVGSFYLLALPSVLKRNKIKFIGIYFLAVFVFTFNYVFFNENWIYLKSIIFPLFFTGLPSFIYAYSIKDWDMLIKIMKKTSNIVFVVGTFIGILVFTGNALIGAYSMSLSYYMLLPTIMYMNEFLDKVSLKGGVILGVSLLVILALGSRGAIMCIGVFAILKLVRKIKKLTYTKVLIYLIILSIMIMGLVFLNEILEYIYNFLLNFGIRSRSIELFLRDDMYLSGRDKLYEYVIEEIFNNPFLGIGLTGDRFILDGGYAHNIFIEILANFGLVIGTIIIITILYIVVKSLFIKDIKKYNMVIVWLSIGFVHLFVSSSYLIDFKFWILLGLSLKVVFTKNKLIDNYD
ncbi:O-antigen ligase family protein [Tissierella pigra]|uniref:O-antigen ligase family protein n=1 Tax=Tissierella pigra TaxID=2607614 RepID=UPI001C11B369|nr:O-antigen ligase family protein [Tissierella pigra]MBU5427910.1 O-antigen ligase family protein [Tissierella pigra]